MAGAKETAQTAERGADGGVELEDPRRHRLTAGEPEQLARDMRGARGRGLDRFEIAADGAVGAGRLQRQLDVPLDHAQHVVEVVRDAAGEAADQLHLLRLGQLLLQPAALRLGAGPIAHVPERRGKPRQRAGRIVGSA